MPLRRRCAHGKVCGKIRERTRCLSTRKFICGLRIRRTGRGCPIASRSFLSRSLATYQQRITHFTETLDFLSNEDKEWVMGRAIVERLGWK
jgi:hypothetical protein